MTMLRCCFQPSDLADRWPFLKQAYLCGPDDVPWRTWTEVKPGMLTCVAEGADSCSCHVLWPVTAYGCLGLRTTSLPERAEPYDLNIELVRGKMARVQEVQRELEEGGVRAASRARVAIRDVRQLFFDMLFRAPADAMAELSDRCLSELVRIGDELILDYARTISEQRKRLKQMPLLIVRAPCAAIHDVDLHELSRFVTTVQILAPWSEIERQQGEYDWSELDRAVTACRKAGLSVGLGPLVCWEKYALPDWLWLYTDRFDAILEFATRFVGAVTARYRDSVRVWELASRLNCGAALLFEAVERLQLAAGIAAAAAPNLDGGFCYITLGQPWSEYSAHVEDTGAFYFADTLCRLGGTVRGLGIEITTGYGSGLSWPRDLVEIAYVLARYGSLGLPLVVTLAAPVSPAASERTLVQTECLNGLQVGETPPPIEWVAHASCLAASRPDVAALVWSHLTEHHLGMYPRAGFWGDPSLRTALLKGLRCEC